MNSSEHSTVTTLEEMLDLLRGETPDPAQALERLESILQHQPCAKEYQAANMATADIIDQLLLPVLNQDPARLQQAKILQEHLRRDTLTEENQEEQNLILKNMEGWVIDCTAPDIQVTNAPAKKASSPPEEAATVVALPRTLFARLTATLSLMCESEEQLGASIAVWQKATTPPWEAMATILHDIQVKGHKAAEVPWMRQRRAFYDSLLHVAHACETAITHTKRQNKEIPSLIQEMSKQGSRVEAHRIHNLLYTRVSELQQEARHIKRRQTESRERAEQLKSRLDQLERELTRARSEQFLDPVTGIPDHFAFSAHLQRYLERGVHLKEVFSLVLFHFYGLQDQLNTLDAAPEAGVGKRLVTTLVSEIRRHIPGESFLARLSTERFVVLLPKYAEDDGAQMATTVANALEDICFQLDDKEVLVEVHSGCAAYRSGMDATEIVEITNRLVASAQALREGDRQKARRVQEC